MPPLRQLPVGEKQLGFVPWGLPPARVMVRQADMGQGGFLDLLMMSFPLGNPLRIFGADQQFNQQFNQVCAHDFRMVFMVVLPDLA